MQDRKVAPKIIFERIEKFIPQEVSTTINHYEQFMQGMGFKDTTDNDNDPVENFDKKSYAEQQEITAAANNLRHQLLELKSDSKDVYNALLLLSYYFPLNKVNNKGQLLCPKSNQAITNQNRFVASNGNHYSKNYLFKEWWLNGGTNMDNDRLRSIQPKSRNFWPEKDRNGDDLLTTLMLTSGFLGMIGGSVAGALIVAATGAAVGAASFLTAMGIATGVIIAAPVAVLVIWTVGYGIMKLYDEFDLYQRNKKEPKQFDFLEPTKSVVLKTKQPSTHSNQFSQLNEPAKPSMTEGINPDMNSSLSIPVAYPVADSATEPSPTSLTLEQIHTPKTPSAPPMTEVINSNTNSSPPIPMAHPVVNSTRDTAHLPPIAHPVEDSKSKITNHIRSLFTRPSSKQPSSLSHLSKKHMKDYGKKPVK